MSSPTITHAMVEDAVDVMVRNDKSYCECRRSPFDSHDVNPPCETRRYMADKMREVLEELAPSILEAAKKEKKARKARKG